MKLWDWIGGKLTLLYLYCVPKVLNYDKNYYGPLMVAMLMCYTFEFYGLVDITLWTMILSCIHMNMLVVWMTYVYMWSQIMNSFKGYYVIMIGSIMCLYVYVVCSGINPLSWQYEHYDESVHGFIEVCRMSCKYM